MRKLLGRAALYMLVHSAPLKGLNRPAYLTYVLEYIAADPINRIRRAAALERFPQPYCTLRSGLVHGQPSSFAKT